MSTKDKPFLGTPPTCALFLLLKLSDRAFVPVTSSNRVGLVLTLSVLNLPFRRNINQLEHLHIRTSSVRGNKPHVMPPSLRRERTAHLLTPRVRVAKSVLGCAHPWSSCTGGAGRPYGSLPCASGEQSAPSLMKSLSRIQLFDSGLGSRLFMKLRGGETILSSHRLNHQIETLKVHSIKPSLVIGQADCWYDGRTTNQNKLHHRPTPTELSAQCGS